MRLLTRAPEDSTSISMALVQASSRERCPCTAWLPCSEKNSRALPSSGPLPIFSLHIAPRVSTVREMQTCTLLV